MNTDDHITRTLADLRERAGHLVPLNVYELERLLVDVIEVLERAWLNPASGDLRYAARRNSATVARER